jgi:hypothetical protein
MIESFVKTQRPLGQRVGRAGILSPKQRQCSDIATQPQLSGGAKKKFAASQYSWVRGDIARGGAVSRLSMVCHTAGVVRSAGGTVGSVRWWVTLAMVWAAFSSGIWYGPSVLHADDAKVAAHLKELEAPVIDSSFAALLRQAPNLCRGGAQVFTADRKWVAVAVGRAALEKEDGKELALSDATKVARTKAHRELAKLLYGYRASAQDTKVTTSLSEDVCSEDAELFRSVSQQDIKATLTRVEIVGTWKLDEGSSVAVMVATGDPQHPAFQHRRVQPSACKFRNERWEGNWRNIFVTRPAILTGGASLYQRQDAIYILAVGRARLKGDPVADMRRDLVGSVSASREALQLVKGLQVVSQIKATQESRQMTADELTVTNEVHEILETTNSEKLSQAIRMTKPVGNWESEDGQYHFAAFALNLADLP